MIGIGEEKFMTTQSKSKEKDSMRHKCEGLTHKFESFSYTKAN